jgi:hypothetical protein
MSYRLFRVLPGILALVAALVFLGCSTPTSKVQRLVGPKAAAILAAAQKVETFRLDPESVYSAKPEYEGKTRIDGYVITATGKTQGPEFARRLAAILLREETYEPAAAKCFDPGVAFRVYGGDESVEVLICFMCNDLDVRPNALGQRLGNQLADFPREVRPQLLKLVQEAFPDDKDIQALK